VPELLLGRAGVDHEQLRVLGMARVDRMGRGELPERASERDVLLRGDGLVAEEEDLETGQRVAELGRGVRGERLPEVHAAHLRADRPRDRAEPESLVGHARRHGCSRSSIARTRGGNVTEGSR
jgi:hypothetical protein